MWPIVNQASRWALHFEWDAGVASDARNSENVRTKSPHQVEECS
jgi:hypothetical protein